MCPTAPLRSSLLRTALDTCGPQCAARWVAAPLRALAAGETVCSSVRRPIGMSQGSDEAGCAIQRTGSTPKWPRSENRSREASDTKNFSIRKLRNRQFANTAVNGANKPPLRGNFLRMSFLGTKYAASARGR
eukprot:1647191-Prymnesium_polylepis.1